MSAGQTSARLHAIVTGVVQGVNFRWFTQKQATTLGLVGYVRNRADGSVEVVAEGARGALETFLAQLYIGPSHADVEKVQLRWSESRAEFTRFEIR